MENCIFCKIVNGNIPCYKVNENTDFLAFLDINQATFGHTLVIPKKHFANFMEVTNSAKYFTFMQETAKLLSEKLNTSDFNFVSNCGLNAGQEVFHVHFHIIPRYPNDNFKLLELSNFEKIDPSVVFQKISS